MTQTRSLYERWQRLEADKKAVSDDLKELFAEAKHAGYDSKALREAFRRATVDEDQQAAQKRDAREEAA